MPRNKGLIVGFVVVCFGAGAFWYLRPRDCPAPSPEVVAIRDEAIRLQQEGQDKLALEMWRQFLARLPNEECFAGERKGATLNIVELEKREGPNGSTTTASLAVQQLPEDYKSPEDEVERAAKFYQKGRRVQSLATLDVTGEGVFKDWGFRTRRHFAYLHRIPVETRVIENQGGRKVVFEQTVGDFAELMAHSTDDLQLELPQSPILETLTHEFDRRVAPYSWQYRVVRDLTSTLAKLDPNLKRTLTGFHDLLRHGGAPLSDQFDVDYVARLKELAGTRVRIEYVVGLGVTHLDVLEGKKFPESVLRGFAHDANVTADFVLAKQFATATDQPFKVGVDRLSSLMSMSADAVGELELVKVSPGEGADPDIDELRIIGGAVRFKAREGDREANGAVTPKPGAYLKYDRRRHLVTEAKAEWNIDSQWKSGDHLFFQADSLRGVRARSSYLARSLSENGE